MRAMRRLTRAAVTLAAVTAIGAGCWMTLDGLHTRTPPAPSTADALPPPTPGPTGSVTPALPVTPTATPPGHSPTAAPRTSAPALRASAMPYSPPVRIRIPRIGVDAPITRLDADASGHLGVPPEGDRNLVGWYEFGPSPGSAGNAIMDGHVDTPQGPAVFYNLSALHKGATVLVTRADRTVAEFSVYAVEVYAKADFPDERVYGPTHDPELRLLTCGGTYTKSTGYQANVVVFARFLTDRQQ